MADSELIFQNLVKKIEDIQKSVNLGEINLLDLELVPLFNDLRDTLNIKNLNEHSRTYKEAYNLLDHKFNELKSLLSSSNIEQKFLKYFELNPSDEEISSLFENCWRKAFAIDVLSYQFLDSSKSLLKREKRSPLESPTIEYEEYNEDFILKVPKLRYTEKMTQYLEEIKKKMPCSFNDIFEEEQDDINLCKNFVYILHLLQSGMIKFQKETNFLYLEEEE